MLGHIHGRRGGIGFVWCVGLLGVMLALVAGLAGTPLAPNPAPGAAGAPLLTATPTPACGPAWQLVPSPNVGRYNNTLSGVSAVSPNDIWAVGWYDYPAGDALAAHWDGTSWTAIPTPPIYRAQLFGVVALAHDNVWAAGTEAQVATLLLHWDGQTWTRVPSPNQSSGPNSLTAIAAVSAADIWAVGTWTDNGGADHTLTEHWDGSQWTIVSSPSPQIDPALLGVAARAQDDVWAVGTALDSAGGETDAIALHWDGSAWTAVTPPNGGALNNFLQAVTMAGAQDVWAAGWSNNNSQGEIDALIEHWNGTAWSVVPGPNLGRSSDPLYGIQARTATDIWAVGSRAGGGSLTLHWDGAAWAESPNILGGQLNGVASLAADDVWVVGQSMNMSRIEQYGDPCSTPLPTATGTPPTVPPSRTPSPTATGTPPSATPTVAACGPQANYAISARTGTALDPGMQLVPGSQCDDCTVSAVLPFTVSIYGNPSTMVNLSSNGTLQFDTNLSNGSNTCLPAAFGDTIFAYWDDLNMQTFSCDHCGIFAGLSGSAPHRVYNLEWRALHFLGGAAYTNFEVRFFEDQPDQFELIYGRDDLYGSSATIGVQNAAGTRVTQYECGTGGLSTGLALIFSLPDCPPPTATLPPATATSIPPSPTSTRLAATTTPIPPSPPPASPTPCALAFSDVHPTDYFYTAVRYLACRGVISGYADGTFRPYANTTRAQQVKIVVLGFQTPIHSPAPGQYTFADVPPSQPFFSYIETAAAAHIVGGYTCGGPGEPCDVQHRPYFRPSANVTRGQLGKIDVSAAGWGLVNPALGTFADVAPGSAFYQFVETAYCHGVISGYTCGGPGEPCDPQQRPYYRPGGSATRGQIAKIVYNSLAGGGSCPSAVIR